MKTTVLLNENTIQIVLTPENKFETGIISEFGNKLEPPTVFRGTFEECNGGWIKQYNTQIDSLILRHNKAKGD